MIKPRQALFKWRHFEPEIIICAVRWYLRFSLSYRDVEELLLERDLPADHTTIWRWVQRYAPELNRRCRRELKPTNGSWSTGQPVYGEFLRQAAIGVSYKPRQCGRQRYESRPIGDVPSPVAGSGNRPSSPACVRYPL